MALALLVVALSAAPLRVAVGPVVFSGEAAPHQAPLIEYLVSRLRTEGMQISSQREVLAAIGLERQRQLLGCTESESSACLAELAGALGADGLLTGSVGELSGRWVVNLKVISPAGQTVGSSAVEAASVEALLPAFEQISHALVQSLAATFPGRVAARSSGVPRAIPIVLAALGAGLAITGAVLEGIARDKNRALFLDPSLPQTVGELDRTLGTIRDLERWGWVSIGAAGALAATAAVLFFLGPKAPAATVAPIAGGGGMLSVGGAW